MNARRWLVALLLLLLSSVAAVDAAEIPIPPAPTAWVTDTAAFLKPQTDEALDARLGAYEASTGHQILVYIAPTTGITPTEEWTIHAFTKWKVGRKGIDDGLVMFVFPADHKVRIEVGYGLEQTVPDAVASRIIRNTVTPKIHDGKPDDAVVSGVDDLLATVGGEAVTPAATPAPAATPEESSDDSGQSPLSVFAGIVIAIVICFVVIYLIGKLPQGREPYYSGRNYGFGLWDVLSIGGSLLGGFSGGGGGFSGGGGSGGGGGATGSW